MGTAFHLGRLIPTLIIVANLSTPSASVAQDLFDSTYLKRPSRVVNASFDRSFEAVFADTRSFSVRVGSLLKPRLSAAQYSTAILILEGPDSGLRAASYAELAANLPMSSKTIMRLLTQISADENISIERVEQDLVTSLINGSSRLATKSTQAATSIGPAGAAGLGAAAALGLAAVALGGGVSGSSSGGSCTTLCVTFDTEYSSQYGLGTINTKAKNDAGYTGAGVKVAVVDSGIDSNHSEFSGRAINGVNYVAIGGGFGADETGHGTHVASTIGANRDGNGMRGVAYNVDLFSYKIIDSTGFVTGFNSDAGWAAVANRHVTDNIQVSNNSWGSSTPVTSSSAAILNGSFPLTLAALANAQASGTIFVWANGNDGANEVVTEAGMAYLIPSLASQWLSVTAIDSTKTEANYTNRCGVAWDTCVTAPGTDIYAAKTGGGYVSASGTSMAAPHVSGLAALLVEEFPALTPAQIVTRLKSTANYDGLTGRGGCTSGTCTTAQMRAIFGHGLVNQQAATAAIGSLNYTTSENLFTGPSVNIAAAALKLPNGIGASAINAVNNASFTAFDSFDGAAFAVSGTEVFGSSADLSTNSIGYATMDAKNSAEGERFRSLAILSDGLDGFPAIMMSQSAAPIDVASLSIWGDKSSLMPTPDFIHSESISRIEIIAGDASSNLKIIPYIQFSSTDTQENTGGFGVNIVYDAGENTRLVTSLGHSNSAFDFDLVSTGDYQRTALDSIELGFAHKFSSSWELFGRVSQGFTKGFQASTTNWGLNDAQFSRATLGVEYKAKDGARVAFGLVNGGNFTSGELSLVAATGRQTNGNINYAMQTFDAASNAIFVPFLSAKLPAEVWQNLNGVMTFSIQQSPNSATAISRADISFSIGF